ncbi:MAG TPA: glycine oxidase ThiO [Pyrinomonadaceae bacterium]|nr:glycine oxidase ThiO [Pyrinomonadaceae bacterium]
MFSDKLNFTEQPKQNRETFDAIVIGGGVIGLSIARELKKRGVGRVLILEKNAHCGAEASNAAAGMLAPQAEADSADDFFNLCRQSRDLYPNFAAELFEESGIDVRLDQTGTLYLAFDEKDLEEIEKRFVWQRAADLPVEKISRKAVLELEPNVSEKVLGALRFPLDWQVENRDLIRALVESVQKQYVLLRCSTKVEKILFENGKAVGVVTDKGEIRAQNVIVAAGAWTCAFSEMPFDLPLESLIKPVRGQMLSFAYQEKPLRHVVYSARGYIVPRSDNRVLIGATVEDVGFDKSVTGGGLLSLLRTAAEISPKLCDSTVSEIWAGLRPASRDDLPIIGEFPENSNLYFATGHYRNGILLAPLTARLIADKIVEGKNSPFLQIFNLSRFQS